MKYTSERNLIFTDFVENEFRYKFMRGFRLFPHIFFNPSIYEERQEATTYRILFVLIQIIFTVPF